MVRKNIWFVNFQVIDTPAGAVGLRAYVDRFS